MSRASHVHTLKQALQLVDERVADASRPLPGSWTLAQVLEHCAQSIEYSMDGFPRLKSWLFRRTIGPLAARRFLKRHRLRHDLNSPIPGAAAIAASGELDAAVQRLQRATERFRAHQGPLFEHFAFGRLDKSDFATLHALHIADHLRHADLHAKH